MVALSPRFTFLAALSTLAALSLAPVSDAAVLRLRDSEATSTKVEAAQTLPAPRGRTALANAHRFASRDAHRHVQVYDSPPVIPLPVPEIPEAPQKGKADSDDSSGHSGSQGDGKHLSDEEKDVPSGNKDKDASHGDTGSVSEKDKKAKGKDRRFYPFLRPSELWSGDKKLGDNHPLYVRAPHHHHHHHHHHDRRRHGSRIRRGDPELDHDRSSSVISADNEREVRPRAPHRHHGYEKVIVSGDHDHVHVRRSPHHHSHHYHHGHEEIIVSGDNDHVHVDRSVFIAGEQGQSYVVPHTAKRNVEQELFTVPSLSKRASVDGVPGHIDIMSPVADSQDGERIASLVLASSDFATPDNSTTSSAFVLNASETNVTQMYLHPYSSDSPSSTLTPGEMPVTLSLAMFDATSASIVSYCATFDPKPPAPAPLTAEECTDDPASEHRSQVFAYNPDTGIVRPMWYQGQDDGTDSGNNGCAGDVDPTTPQSASLASVTEMDSSNTTLIPSTDRAPMSNFSVLAADSSSTAPSDPSGGNFSAAQTVALVFVAADPELPDTPAVASTTSSSVPATATGAESSSSTLLTENSSSAIASSAPGPLAIASPTVVATTSSSSSVPTTSVPSAQPVSAASAPVLDTLTSVPSSTSLVPGPSSAPTVLGVQVVAEQESNAASAAGANPTPTMTPVNTRPYEWMFKLDSRQK